MPFGAGGATARRRRDLDFSLVFDCFFSYVSSFSRLMSQSFRTFSLSQTFFKPTSFFVQSLYSGRRWRRCPATLFQIKSLPTALIKQSPPPNPSLVFRSEFFRTSVEAPLRTLCSMFTRTPSSTVTSVSTLILARPDLSPEVLPAVSPPSMMSNREDNNLTLMLLIVYCCGPGPREEYFSSSPVATLSKSMKTFGGLSPTLLRPRSVFFYSLGILRLMKSRSFKDCRRRFPRTIMMELIRNYHVHSRTLFDRVGYVFVFVNLELSQALDDSSPLLLSSRSDLNTILDLVWICQPPSKTLAYSLSKLELVASLILKLLTLFKTLYHLALKGPKLGSFPFVQHQTDYKLCVEFLNLHGQWLHVREDPPVLLRLCTHYMRSSFVASSEKVSQFALMSLKLLMLARNPTFVSSMEHPITSSYALIARAIYDHPLVKDFAKPVFMVESAMVPKDFSNIASPSKLSISLENSWNPYLSFHCTIFAKVCMNSPLLRL